MFVVDAANKRVVKFDPFGHQLATFGGFYMPVTIALDRAGNVYVGEQNAMQVIKLSPSGTVLARWHIAWANRAGRWFYHH